MEPLQYTRQRPTATRFGDYYRYMQSSFGRPTIVFVWKDDFGEKVRSMDGSVTLLKNFHRRHADSRWCGPIVFPVLEDV